MEAAISVAGFTMRQSNCPVVTLTDICKSKRSEEIDRPNAATAITEMAKSGTSVVNRSEPNLSQGEHTGSCDQWHPSWKLCHPPPHIQQKMKECLDHPLENTDESVEKLSFLSLVGVTSHNKLSEMLEESRKKVRVQRLMRRDRKVVGVSKPLPVRVPMTTTTTASSTNESTASTGRKRIRVATCQELLQDPTVTGRVSPADSSSSSYGGESVGSSGVESSVTVENEMRISGSTISDSISNNNDCDDNEDNDDSAEKNVGGFDENILKDCGGGSSDVLVRCSDNTEEQTSVEKVPPRDSMPCIGCDQDTPVTLLHTYGVRLADSGLSEEYGGLCEECEELYPRLAMLGEQGDARYAESVLSCLVTLRLLQQDGVTLAEEKRRAMRHLEEVERQEDKDIAERDAVITAGMEVIRSADDMFSLLQSVGLDKATPPPPGLAH